MKKRCNNFNDKDFPRYGGRGITVCPEWSDSFETFIQDMDPRPDGMTLERVNNDGNYEPGNCQWGSPSRQRRNQNREDFVCLTLNGETMIAANWAKRIGVHKNTIYQRISRGWPIHRVLQTKFH